MSSPETFDSSAPPDPALYRPRRGLPFAFWAAILFGVLCIVGGTGVFLFGPKLFPKPVPAAAVAPPPAAAAIDARLADIQARLGAHDAALPQAAEAGSAASAQVNALADRIDRVEANQTRLMNAASGALAASSLADAASSSRPFAAQLASLEPALPDSIDVRALRAYAETGAPTTAALAAEFQDVAARAAVAARAHAEGEGFMARVAQAIAAIVTIRRVDKLNGKDADAVLARAQRRLDDGDLGGALGELQALPPAAAQSTAQWRMRAARRVEVDRRIGAIRSAALAELTRASVPRPAP